MLLLVGTLLTATLTACTTDPEVIAADPAVGQCRQLDRPEQFDVLSDASPTVDCTERHTAETYLVGELAADRMAYPALGEREAVAAEACPPAQVRRYLDAHPRQALYGVWTVPWLPSEAAWDEGERWVRCDLVTVADEAGAFDPVEHSVSLAGAAADGARAESLTRCYTAAEGAVADPLLAQSDEVLDVRCDQPHDSRDVNHWLRQVQQPSTSLAIRECASAVQEWIGLGLAPSVGTGGVLREEANGNLTLRCVSIDGDVAA